MSCFFINRETANWAQRRHIPVAEFETVGSTNDVAKEEALGLLEELKIYVSDSQTHGRGRNQNHWENSPHHGALLATWSFRVEYSPMALTAPLIGLALFEALGQSFPNVAELISMKAPNDIYLANKKMAGLLIEAVSTTEKIRLIIGLGLNVFSAPQSVEMAGALMTPDQFNTTIWSSFLDQLRTRWQQALPRVHAHHLAEDERLRLLTALNQNPLLNEKYTNISPFGDLCTANRTISWRDL